MGSRRQCHVSWVLRACVLKCRDEFAGMSAFVNQGDGSPRPEGQRIDVAGGHAMIGLRTQAVNGSLPFAIRLAGSKRPPGCAAAQVVRYLTFSTTLPRAR